MHDDLKRSVNDMGNKETEYFRLMQSNQKHTNNIEWVCRIILTIHLFRIAAGYITILQADYKLTSPLIPSFTVYEIAKPYILPSFLMICSFVLALWFYFYQKKLVSLIISGISLVAFEVWLTFFLNDFY